ncbi:TetR/AcrR family transcriptional regulator [Erwinia sp. P6884]|uniref:TetR/AcrR family transcriptional regulator n=1 Tax=Erwinia sp. P6884 TaxID=3141450 RepID=UPI0031869C05
MITSAMHIFDTESLRGVGIDRVVAHSGVSTRTLYKHFGSRDGLILAVLKARHLAFMEQLAAECSDGDPVGAVFDSLRQWMEVHGTQGCMLLRARSEYATANEEIVALVHRQKSEFRAELARRVRLAVGEEDERIINQIWLLFEGATASAAIATVSIIDDARDAAHSLLTVARARKV